MSSDEFEGSDRFEIEERIGSGGFGIVYRAYDREKKTVVALKTLPRVGAESLLRFKNEFRMLADISHPNLVSLYELIGEGNRWFFSMELVDGVDVLDYIYGSQRPSVRRESPTEIVTRIAGGDDDPVPRVVEKSPHLCYPDVEERLRSSLAQLVNGLSHLHSRGRLHRDIKPGNVLVTPGGRLVLLDFGLATELRHPVPDSSLQYLVGTPEYMAPEFLGGEITPASDWYSVGTILYEALAGRLPYRGEGAALLMQKAGVEPPDPCEFSERVPDDLRDLSLRLLARHASARPSELEIRAAIKQRPTSPVRITPADRVRLIGRERHLDKLDRALALARSGRASVVVVRGRSGMGKTHLVQHFLEAVRRRFPDAVALLARCYERESVPYKALDALADGLMQTLRELPADERARVLPDGIADLARIFPVFASIASEHAYSPTEDPQEQRRLAFAALRELLRKLALTRPVVLAIDDLHWGDVDSAFVLADIFRGGDPPPLLLISSYRSEEADTAPFFQTFRRAIEAGAVAARTMSHPRLRMSELLSASMQHVIVDELSFEEARTLALQLLGEAFPGDTELAEAIARESGGSPFFVHELVRFALSSAEKPDTSELRLDRVLASRLSRLSDDARRILFTVAVAGRPISQIVCRTAAGVENAYQTAVAVLRAASMVRVQGSRDDDLVETYHDRIRQMVLSSIATADLRELHESLATTLEAADDEDLETIAQHYHAAGDLDRAVEIAYRAADRAAGSLASDAAARLYRALIDWTPRSERRKQFQLHVEWAEVLVSAGRASEASRAFIAATTYAPAEQVVELRRRAAEQLLRSGHVDEGLAVIRTVLDAVGLDVPTTSNRVVAQLLWRRLKLRVRGTRYRARDLATITPDELTRVDATWSVAIGLGLIDPLRGANFQTRHVLDALRLGEPYRVARALAVEAGYVSSQGSRAAARRDALLERAGRVAKTTTHPHAPALIALVRGMGDVLAGDWIRGQEHCEAAEQILRSTCRGVAWELFNARLYALIALLWRGELAQLWRRLPRLVDDVTAREDLFAETYLRSRLTWLEPLLVQSSPEMAAAEEKGGIGRWTHRGFHTHHYHHLLAQSEIAIYAGDPGLAYQILMDGWSSLEGSMLLHAQIVFIEAHYARARAAIAAAARLKKSRTLLADAKRSSRLIRGQRAKWGAALADLLDASLASMLDGGEAARAFAHAEVMLESCDMRMHAAAARLRRAELVRDGAMEHEAAETIRAQQVSDPYLFARLLAP